MRTLTQVWVFFIALTFIFLFLGFQLAGRAGLFVAFLISVFVVYATLHRGLRLFKKKLNAQEFTGNDVTGFLAAIQEEKLNFGFKNIYTYQTHLNTPPLIWRSSANSGHLIINSNLLENLSPVEINFLAKFLLSHLRNRSFLITPILSVINQSFLSFNFFSILLSYISNFFFKTQKNILMSDEKFKNSLDASSYEVGFFINKLHQFKFHQSKKQIGTEFFSVLSFENKWLYRHFGIPDLKTRLEKIMGFYL